MTRSQIIQARAARPLRRRPGPGDLATLLLVIAAAALVGACTPESPGAASSAQASGTPGAQADGCPPVDLRGPSGDRVDLTGTWSGRGALHYIRQVGECVWWIALSNAPGEPAGSYLSISFQGRVRPDFTLAGDWGFVVKPARPDAPPANLEPVVFTIGFVEVNGQETVVIYGPGADANTGGPIANFYSAISLERVGPLPPGG